MVQVWYIYVFWAHYELLVHEKQSMMRLNKVPTGTYCNFFGKLKVT